MSMKSTTFADPSKGGRTRQEQKDQCDVNLIVKQHLRGGVSAHVMNRVAEYGFAPALTFQDCMNQVREAQEVFDALPSATRSFFANDPDRFVAYVSDPKRKAELLELGCLVEKPKAAPVLGSAENPIVTRSVDEDRVDAEIRP